MNARLVCLVACALSAGHLRAQPVDTVLSAFEEIARFDDARALARDPSGALHVVDAGRDVVLRLGAGGEVLGVLGGPGAEDGQFDEPSDIDPTNGLVWVVADAGNGRLQRFSRTFLHLESLRVARVDGFAPGVASRRDPVANDTQSAADGRPVAVAAGPSGELFAIDEARGVVLKWDASRRLERTIGGYDAAAGTLSEPVALAADARTLYVGDRGHGAVLAYDLFGTFERSVAGGLADDVVAVSAAEGTLWIVLPARILVYDRGERLESSIGIDWNEPLVDAEFAGRTVWLLTSTRLLRAFL